MIDLTFGLISRRRSLEQRQRALEGMILEREATVRSRESRIAELEREHNSQVNMLTSRLAELENRLNSERQISNETSNANKIPLYIGRNQILVHTNWRGYVVAPSFNVDVALGVIRDGIIEAWTTRLIQDLVKPGQVIINGGANFGYYASLFGNIVGQNGIVIAIEANSHVLPFLVMTKFWAGLDSIMKIYNRALWNSPNQTLDFNFDPQYMGGATAEILTSGCSDYGDGQISDAFWSSATLPKITDAHGLVEPSRGLYLKTNTKTTTIDQISPLDRPVDMIHLDIEGSEAFALLGAMHTIRRSPTIKIIMEWSGHHQHVGSCAARDAATRMWEFLTNEGFICRRILPKLSESGGVYLSKKMDEDYMMNSAIHGDYIWCRVSDDPWANN